MNEDAPEYDALADTLADAGVISSLSEIHGGICGVMCIGGIAAAEHWLDRTLEEWQVTADGVQDALRGLELNTWRMLSDTAMSFEPLLPGDDEPLDTQVRGLALWCHGFLTGLGFGGIKRLEGSDNSELDEITRDFAELSRAAVSEEDAENAEQSGFALAELKEYVRVSVQLVFERYEALRPEARGDSIH